MIKPAKRLEHFNEYFFSERSRYIKSLIEEGKDVINLGIGSPDMAPSEATIASLHQSAKSPKNHGYQPYNGTSTFRKAISLYLFETFGVSMNPETEILPLMGSKEGILHVSMAFLNYGENVLIPELGYPAYQSVTKMIGASTIRYKLDENWEPDWDYLENLDLTNVKMLWLNYPHMPTGAPGSIEVFEKAVEFGIKHDILICHDNPYSLVLTPKPISIFKVKGSREVCLELHSLSKSHNMAGWRVGWITGSAELIKSVHTIYSNVHSGMFKGLQEASAEALTNSASWHKERNAVYAKRRDLAFALLDKLKCTYDKNVSGLFVWGKLPKESPDAMQVSSDLLNQKHIFVTPGNIFGSRGNRYIRISLCASEQLFNQALKRI